MCKQFIVYLMNTNDVIERRINTSDIESARLIAQAIYDKYRVIEVIVCD